MPFDRAAAFDFQNALYAIDERRDYGETRIVALGLIGDRVHVLCFVETDDGIRVISLRKANPREVNRYVQNQTPD
ncbi:MAG: BrnT family toxin [Betaproteobacteria bacterium]|nr:BrnT family toxin [Betaproteobacteria bacterium]